MSLTTGLDSGAHPIAHFAARLHAVLDGLIDTPAWSMTPAEQRTVLVELARAQARVEGLRLRVLAAADASGIAAESAATSTGAWVAHHTRVTRAAAHANVKVAVAMDRDNVLTRDALAAGLVDPAQARIIVRAVAALPVGVSTHQSEQAEKHLVQLAGEHDAAALKICGRGVFEAVDPDAADEQEGRKLAAEEAAAARSTYLHLFDNGDGTHTGRFKIRSMHAAILKKMVNAILSPARRAASNPTADPTGDPSGKPTGDRPRPEAMGRAFSELLERFPADRLPTSGGMSATVVVLLDYDKLLSGLGAAHLDTGQRLSASLTRRMACQAGIIPAVYRRALGGRSVVLDMGRTTRLHTEHQRIALDIRDGGCTAESCNRPASACHAHHDRPWSAGGPPVARRASPTAACCAPSTTPGPTPPATASSTCPTTRSASTGGAEGQAERTERSASVERVADREAWTATRLEAAPPDPTATVLRRMSAGYAVVTDGQCLTGHCVLVSDSPRATRLTDLPRERRLRFLADLDRLGEAVQNVCTRIHPHFRGVDLTVEGGAAGLRAHVRPRYDEQPAEHAPPRTPPHHPGCGTTPGPSYAALREHLAQELDRVCAAADAEYPAQHVYGRPPLPADRR